MPAIPETPINTRSIVKLARAYDAARSLASFAKARVDLVRGQLIAVMKRRGAAEAVIEDVLVRLHVDEKRVFSAARARELYLGPKQFEECKLTQTVERLEVRVAKPEAWPDAFQALSDADTDEE